MKDAELTMEAAKLAERILDEISRIDHDWEEVAVLAHELAELGEIGVAGGRDPDLEGLQAHAPSSAGSPQASLERFGARERERVASALSALAHPTRLLILQVLSQGDMLSPTQISELDRSTTLPVIAYHARELRDGGLIKSAGIRQARGAVQHFYALSPRGRTLLELVERLGNRPEAL